jgi:pentatricopeptide repeat protein
MKQKKYSEAITIYQKCLYVYTKLSGWNDKKFHSFVIVTKRQMASAYSNNKQHDEAIRLLEEIISDNYELHPLEEVGVLWELSNNQGKLNLKRERIDTLNKIIELCNEKKDYTYLKTFLKLVQNALDVLKNNQN